MPVAAPDGSGADMHILVIGRDGQLARSLAERGDRGAHRLTFLGRPELDLTDAESIRRGVEAQRPNVVINAAAYTAVDKAEDEQELAYQVNGTAPGVIAGAAQAVGARMIHVSTDYVFAGNGDRPLTEDEPTAPLGVYGQSKLAGEDAVRAATEAHAIVRTAWVYSPWGTNFVRTMLRLAGDRPVLRVVDDQVGSPTSALDLADGLLALADGWADGDRPAEFGTYHLAGSGQASWADVAAAVMEDSAAAGAPSADVERIATSEYPTRATRPRWSVLDSGRFAAETGFTMPSWRASLTGLVSRILEPSR